MDNDRHISTLETKVKTAPRRPNQNAQCVACGRQCYNTGLCMMPWPGLEITEAKQPFLKRQVARPSRTCRTVHPKD
jgi:hypothetical protein